MRSIFVLIAAVLAFTSAQADTVYPPETVVASRGGVSITMADLDAALMGNPQRANIMNSPKRIEEMIERLLINRQVASEARDKKLDQSAEFKRAVELQAERLLSEQYVNLLRATMDIGDVETLAKERYSVNPDAYAVPGTTSVRHILVRADTRSEEEARAIAEKARASALAGEDFIALVSQYSEEQSKETSGGYVPNAESEGVDQHFVAAVKELNSKGEISPVIQTPFGFHVIQLIERVPSTPRTFEQAKGSIVKQIDSALRDARLKEHVDQLKAKELTADPDVVASLRTRYLPKSQKALEKVE